MYPIQLGVFFSIQHVPYALNYGVMLRAYHFIHSAIKLVIHLLILQTCIFVRGVELTPTVLES